MQNRLDSKMLALPLAGKKMVAILSILIDSQGTRSGRREPTER